MFDINVSVKSRFKKFQFAVGFAALQYTFRWGEGGAPAVYTDTKLGAKYLQCNNCTQNCIYKFKFFFDLLCYFCPELLFGCTVQKGQLPNGNRSAHFNLYQIPMAVFRIKVLCASVCVCVSLSY